MMHQAVHYLKIKCLLFWTPVHLRGLAWMKRFHIETCHKHDTNPHVVICNTAVTLVLDRANILSCDFPVIQQMEQSLKTKPDSVKLWKVIRLQN